MYDINSVMTAGEYNTHPVENWRRENGEAPDPEATIDSYKWLDEAGSDRLSRPVRCEHPIASAAGFFVSGLNRSSLLGGNRQYFKWNNDLRLGLNKTHETGVFQPKCSTQGKKSSV
ncbi:MAG: hypothetical protein WBM59_00555 [Sedimenticolaceae bacterium]